MQEDGEVSSVASSIFNQTRSYFTLRQAIEESFVPMSIRNLKLVANVSFFVIILLAFIYYMIQKGLYSQMRDNITSIHYSERRILDIVSLNLRVQDLLLYNEGILEITGD